MLPSDLNAKGLHGIDIGKTRCDVLKDRFKILKKTAIRNNETAYYLEYTAGNEAPFPFSAECNQKGLVVSVTDYLPNTALDDVIRFFNNNKNFKLIQVTSAHHPGDHEAFLYEVGDFVTLIIKAPDQSQPIIIISSSKEHFRDLQLGFLHEKGYIGK